MHTETAVRRIKEIVKNILKCSRTTTLWDYICRTSLYITIKERLNINVNCFFYEFLEMWLLKLKNLLNIK